MRMEIPLSKDNSSPKAPQHKHFFGKLLRYACKAASKPIAKALFWSFPVFLSLYSCQSDKERAKEDTRALISSLKLNGWLAEIPLEQPKRFTYFLHSGSDLSIGFVGMGDEFLALLPSKLQICLNPFKPNKITLECIGVDDSAVLLYKLDTVILPKIMMLDTIGNIVAIFESRVDIGKARSAINVYSEVPVDRKIRRLAFACAMPDASGNGPFYNQMDSITYIPNSYLSDKPAHRMGVFHESAHDYYLTSTSKDAKKAVEGAYNLIKSKYKDLFAIFTESAYIKEPNIGHPQDNANEFFASTSSLLRFCPVELRQKIADMESKDPQKAEIARQACTAVRAAYGRKSPFNE